MNTLTVRPHSSSLVHLSTERGIRYYRTDRLSKTLLRELIALTNEAWGHDYAERAVHHFDESLLRWLVSTPGSFSILAYDADHKLVGCELACRRTFFSGSERYPAYYVTMLTVARHARHQRIAQAILRQLSHVALIERGARLLFSTFDEHASGEPTVRRHAEDAGLALNTTRPLHLWMATSSLRACHEYEAFRGVERLALLPGVRHAIEWRPRKSRVLQRQVDPAFLNPHRDFSCGFVPDAGFRRSYDGASRNAQTIGFESLSGQRGYVVQRRLTLTRPDRGQRKLGQIECVDRGDLSEGALARALRTVAVNDAAAGCIATILVESPALSKLTLLRAGFAPAPRSVRFAVRALADAAFELPKLDGAVFADLL